MHFVQSIVGTLFRSRQVLTKISVSCLHIYCTTTYACRMLYTYTYALPRYVISVSTCRLIRLLSLPCVDRNRGSLLYSTSTYLWSIRPFPPSLFEPCSPGDGVGAWVASARPGIIPPCKARREHLQYLLLTVDSTKTRLV